MQCSNVQNIRNSPIQKEKPNLKLQEHKFYVSLNMKPKGENLKKKKKKAKGDKRMKYGERQGETDRKEREREMINHHHPILINFETE